MLQCQDTGLCMHAWVYACKHTLLVTHWFIAPMPDRKAQKFSSTLSFWGNGQQCWRATLHQCPWWGKGHWHLMAAPTSEIPWTEQKETRLCWLHGWWHGLLLSLQCHSASVAPGTWAILIWRVWRLSPSSSTDWLSQPLPPAPLLPHLWNENYDLCETLSCPHMERAVANRPVLSILNTS